MLGLHAAQNLNGGQFYIGCAQLRITGSGSSSSCGPTISIPGEYKAEDDNIYIPNVYNGFDPTGYTAPGGPVASCGAGSGTPTVPAPTTPKPANSTVPVASPIVESPAASVSPVAVETPAASEAPVPESSSAPAPAPSSAPAPSTGSGEEPSGELPATFTLETFITWLEGKAAGAASKARRHARAF